MTKNNTFLLFKGNDERHRELEKEKNDLMNQCSDLRARIQITESELENTKENYKTTKAEFDEMKGEYTDMKGNQSSIEQKYENERTLKERAQQMEDNERRERIAACAQLIAIQQHHAATSESNNTASQKELDDAKSKILEQKELISEQKIEIKEYASKCAQMQGEMAGLKASLAQASDNTEALEQVAAAAGEIAELKQTIKQMEADAGEGKAEYEKRIKELEQIHAVEEQKVFDLEAERRKLQNQVQELRGNVRVFARLRPFLPNDKKRDDEESVITVGLDMTSMTLRDPKKAKDEKGATHKFTFDRAFAAHEGQEDVFKDVSEFVQSALDGYNVTLFSYGQTGSGKTHSMQGSGNEQMRGIIPRSVEQVGATKLKLVEQGWEFEMKVQYVEIYNEVVRDLLNETDEQGSMRILRDAYGMTEIEGVVMIEVNPENKSEIDDIMDIAARNRSVCKTDMNAESSRSHSIFTLHLVAKNESQNAVLRGQLNLCDLAGSERVDRSGAQGKALAEAKNINKSLSCLTGVFTALNSKSQHIPFRDSKLTYLLQPSFSGDGKTLMMINLSPTELSHFESLSTLRFGQMVNSCELGRATKNLNDIDQDKKKQKKGADGGGGGGDDDGDKKKKKADDKGKSPARGKTPPRR
jgi:kinesin family protein C1